jgi:hypothetical protein
VNFFTPFDPGPSLRRFAVHYLDGRRFAAHYLDGRVSAAHYLDGSGFATHYLDGSGFAAHYLDGSGFAAHYLDGRVGRLSNPGTGQGKERRPGADNWSRLCGSPKP